MTENRQVAPYPDSLFRLVVDLIYKPRWVFTLEDNLDRGQGSAGLTLVIRITTPDSYHPETVRSVAHYFPVPPASYNQGAWRRWLFEQIVQVELHEAMEFFTVAGEKPYAPSHGPGNDPYTVKELGTLEDQRTSFRGVVAHS